MVARTYHGGGDRGKNFTHGAGGPEVTRDAEAMRRQVRVEIVGRDRFWHDAFFVEWAHQFPARELKPEPHGLYCVDAGWLADLERVAAQCFSRVVVAPENPGRRHWFRRLLPRRE